jgi:glycosyltransferase A (GT-A) superfamily protein (DUF2064 family)
MCQNPVSSSQMNVEEAGHPRRCVLLFARAPRAEAAVKGLRGGEALFALSQGRVRDAVAALPGVELVLVPPAAQAGTDFGEKLEAAFRNAACRGYEEIVAVPGDVPELTARDLAAAFQALSASDRVLGPSRDGGVWLIGLRADAVSLPDFFGRVPWRTPQVLAALLGNAPKVFLLGELLDVDRRADAMRLRDALRAAKRDARLLAVLEVVLGRRRALSPREALRESPPPFTAPPPSRAPPPFLLSF